MATPTFALLEEEIKKAFEQADQYETRPAFILSLMPLKPIEMPLFMRCKTWTGDKRLKFSPMAVVKSLLLKNLKGISSYQQLIAYLYANPVESRLLGFERFLPSNQTYSVIIKEKIDDEIQEYLDFVANSIRQFAKENGRQLDMDFYPVAKRKVQSKRTVQRHISDRGGKVTRYLKKVILPLLMLPENENYRYKNEDLVNALGYMAERQICANQGCNLMREDEQFKGRALHGRTLLGRLAKLEEKEVLESYINLFDVVFKLAKRRGLVPLHPVILAMDYTDIPYYGDKNDDMIVEGKPEAGTSHKYRHVVIKISEKWGDLFLLAVPIDILTDKREAVRTLIEFAKKRVNINHILVDRGFFSANYISLFDEMGVKYLMPGVKNKRIQRLIDERRSVADITLKNEKYETHIKLIFKRTLEGNTVCFATSLPLLLVYGGNLFSMYSQRWNVETGFRVIKHEFMARTTSKRYKLRLFFFMFSLLLYNVWVIVNAALNRILFGKHEGERLMSAKLFMIKFYEAYVDYEPPTIPPPDET